MKRLALLVMVVLIAYSCTTEQACSRKYPPRVIVKDSIAYKTRTIYRDTTITQYLPADTIRSDSVIYVTISKETGLVNSDTVSATNQWATALAWVENSQLKQLLIQNEQYINFRLDSAVRVTNKHWEKYHSQVKIQKVWVVHWYDKVSRWFTGISFLMLIVSLAWTIIKKNFKPF